METPIHNEKSSSNGASHPDSSPHTLVHTDSPDDFPYEGEQDVRRVSDDTSTIPRQGQAKRQSAADNPDDFE